jgi:hypothetical protein
MLPDDDRPCLLKWRKTHSSREDDFTGTHPDPPAPLRGSISSPRARPPERRWFWTATGSVQLDFGKQPTAPATPPGWRRRRLADSGTETIGRLRGLRSETTSSRFSGFPNPL